MYTIKDDEGYKIVSLSSTFEVSHQATNFGLFKITDMDVESTPRSPLYHVYNQR